MAESKTNSTSAPERKVLFEAFSWHQAPSGDAYLPAAEMADFVGEAQDVARGVAIIAEMIERDGIEATFLDRKGNIQPAILSTTDAGALTRLAIVSLRHLADKAERTLELINDRTNVQGAAA